MRQRRGWWVVVRWLCLGVAGVRGAETVRCPVTADVWLSAAIPEEMDGNGGRAPRIKLKIWQEFGLFDADVTALRGRRIEAASLRLAPTGGGRFGGARGTDLRWFTVSTVSSAWEEGHGTSYTRDEAGRGATFNEASYGRRPWTVPGSKCWDVILGNGNTLRCDVDAGDPQQGWFTIPLDTRLVEALVAGASHGLLVMDGSTGVDRNCTISSREGPQPPYLEVVLGASDPAPPAAPGGLEVRPAPAADATPESGAVLVSLMVPDGAFAYRIRVDGRDLPRWQIPFAAAAGSRQRFLVERLPSDAEVSLEVVAVDRAGNASPPVVGRGRTSPRLRVPQLSPPPPIAAPSAMPPTVAGWLRVWAFPAVCKLDPLSGAIITEKGMEGAPGRNAVWDAGTATVALSAARGEMAAFQLALEATGAPAGPVTVQIEGLEGVSHRLWRAWFVKAGDIWQAEYAIPLDGPLAIPATDNGIAGQRAAVVAVDLSVPADATPGMRRGAVRIAAGAAEARLPLHLDVRRATLPAEVHFNPELNAYSGPGEAGSAQWFDAHRLAHYHRCSINRVNHSHSGRTSADLSPEMGPDGRIRDWARYDRNVGPLLDGSAFAGNPRAGVPVPVLYLPQNENWPLPMLGHYDPGPGIALEGGSWKPLHDIHARPPEQAFSPVYQQAFVTSATDILRHAQEKGWTRTVLQGFNNNKVQYNREKLRGTAWTLDEPSTYLDWQALLFYSRLWHRGAAGIQGVRFAYRGDISRPMWQGSCFDGLMEMMYCNGDLFRMPGVIKGFRRRNPGMTLVCYGSANALQCANHETTAWCLKAYLSGCDGVVPWQSLGGDDAFDRGDRPDNGNALIVDGSRRLGVNAIASFRVHAFRYGAQLAELLRLLEQKRDWGRGHSAVLVGQCLELGAEFQQGFADDAAALRFRELNGDRFEQLREALLDLLDE